MLFIKKYFFSITVAIVIFYLSAAPLDRMPDMPKVEGMDKIMHLLMYFTLTLALVLESRKIKSRLKYFLVISFPIVYGGIIEVLQELFFPLRSGNIWDFFANTAGVLLGFFVAQLILKTYNKFTN